MNYKYLIDSNVLSTSVVLNIIETDFFNDKCVIINEVAHELIDIQLADKIAVRAVSPTLKTLLNLKIVTDDLVKLGILKTDHGNGEALLLAEALSMKDSDNDQTAMDFMRDRPVIVTNEKAVDAYAKSIGIESISGREFTGILKSLVLIPD